MKNKILFQFTWVKILIAIATAMIIARYIWARELIEMENQLFASMGINENWKYLITVPLAILLYYRMFQKESIKAKAAGKPVVSKSVILFSTFSIAFVAIYLATWV